MEIFIYDLGQLYSVQGVNEFWLLGRKSVQRPEPVY